MTLSDTRRPQTHGIQPDPAALLDGAGRLLASHFPLRARFLRPVTTGRRASGALATEEKSGAGTTLHDDVPCALEFQAQLLGAEAGPALRESRTQAHLLALKLMPDVRETDQVEVTDPAAGSTERYFIRAAGVRRETGYTAVRIERA